MSVNLKTSARNGGWEHTSGTSSDGRAHCLQWTACYKGTMHKHRIYTGVLCPEGAQARDPICKKSCRW